MSDYNNKQREPQIRHEDFVKISRFVESTYGLKLPDYKKYLIQSRLLRRLNALGIATYSEYVKYLFDPKHTDEIQKMIDVVTTHKTDFYRESDHFEYLENVLLPDHVKKHDDISIWSAGCSTGEEVYTLAFVISEFNRKKNHKLDYQIFGSDVSVSSIQEAAAAVYQMNKTVGVPIDILKRYFLKNKNKDKKFVKIVPEIRKKTKFFKLNFLDKVYNVNKKFDIIMCRNTLIYFSRETQREVLSKLIDHLNPNGYLIIGHSESIFSMDLPVKLVKTTIFKKI
ncbi:MAG: hypothetical protein JXR68_07765 [Bacteroidales bacterium]|nr:hypothetical protein [Bacteroidales bacterium]